MLKNGKRAITFKPVVCVVDSFYQICVPASVRCVMKLQIGDKVFYSATNGLKNTTCKVHKFTVEQEILDNEKQYTLQANLPHSEMIVAQYFSKTFSFKPLTKSDDIRIYHISDSHGLYKESINAAKKCQSEIDLLVLNGDISSSTNTYADILANHKIAFEITKGELPCIITRGNHDLRGSKAIYSDKLLPDFNGHHYYFAHLKNIDFAILDCGEDKDDSHREYSGMAAFHEMRLAETRFFQRELPLYAKRENRKPYSVVISHITFNYRNNELCKGERPFDIEDDTYRTWCELINKHFEPNLYIAGHHHRAQVWGIDDENNHRHLNCPTLIGGLPKRNEQPKSMVCCLIKLSDGVADIVFNDSDGNIVSEEKINVR